MAKLIDFGTGALMTTDRYVEPDDMQAENTVALQLWTLKMIDLEQSLLRAMGVPKYGLRLAGGRRPTFGHLG